MTLKIVPVIVFGLAINILAQHADLNFSRMRYGTNYPAISARIAGLGGAGISGGGSDAALMVNPALASGIGGTIEVRAGWLMRQSEEDRSFPYYDSFVGFVDYGTYAFNSNRYNNLYFSVLAKTPEFWGQRLFIGTGYLPFNDQNYSYVEEVRDPVDKTDKLLGYHRLEQEGTLYSVPVLLAAKPFTGLSVGWQLNMLTGTLDSISATEPKLYQDPSIRQTVNSKSDLNNLPLVQSLGAAYEISEHFGAALSVRLPYVIEWKRTSTITTADTSRRHSGVRRLEYPLSVGVGLDYRFINPLQARLMIDVYYDFWSRFADSGRPELSLSDTYTIRTGIEHLFFDQVPFRVGFAFGFLPENKEVTNSLLTLGTGYASTLWELNLSAGISSTEFYQNDLFAESIFGLTDRTDSDRVKVTEYFVRADITVSIGQ